MTPIVGHDDVMAELRDAIDRTNRHHAWIFAGPRGIGKQTIATMIARFLLVHSGDLTAVGEGFAVSSAHPAAQLFDAGTHPDFMRIERMAKDRKGDGDADQALARNIGVDQIRQLRDRLHRTGTITAQRVILIDAADDMEAGAANALLKILEEPPPNTLFLLISHAIGLLLPTIRSRCRVQRFAALGAQPMHDLAARLFPDIDAEARAALVASSGGSPGMMLQLSAMAIADFDAVARAVERGAADAFSARRDLSRQLAQKAASARYEAFLQYFPSRIARAAKEKQGAALEDAIALWERAVSLAQGARRLSLDPESTVFEMTGMVPRA